MTTTQTGSKWSSSKLTHRADENGRPVCGTTSRSGEYVTSETVTLVTCYKCLGCYNTRG